MQNATQRCPLFMTLRRGDMRACFATHRSHQRHTVRWCLTMCVGTRDRATHAPSHAGAGRMRKNDKIVTHHCRHCDRGGGEASGGKQALACVWWQASRRRMGSGGAVRGKKRRMGLVDRRSGLHHPSVVSTWHGRRPLAPLAISAGQLCWAG